MDELGGSRTNNGKRQAKQKNVCCDLVGYKEWRQGWLMRSKYGVYAYFLFIILLLRCMLAKIDVAANLVIFFVVARRIDKCSHTHTHSPTRTATLHCFMCLSNVVVRVAKNINIYIYAKSLARIACFVLWSDARVFFFVRMLLIPLPTQWTAKGTATATEKTTKTEKGTETETEKEELLYLHW